MLENHSPNRRLWQPLPARWVPVWISLEATAGRRDALQDAVEGFVRLGVTEAGGIATELGLPVTLVESAIALGLAAGSLEQGPAGLRAREVGDEGDSSPEEAGWLAWDHAAGRPLLQLWADPSLPGEGLRAEGWEVLPLPERYRRPGKVHDDRLHRALRVMGHAPEVTLLRPIGLGVDEDERARVRRVRRRLGERLASGWIWAPVEHRIQGTVVWRPSLAPMAEVRSELDPQGWGGLAERLSAEQVAQHEQLRARLRDEIAPGILERAGFESVEEMREEAARTAARELGGAATWPRLRVAVEAAFLQQRLAEIIDSDWRTIARGWADVLEVLSLELAQACRGAIRSLRRSPRWGAQQERDLKRRLGGKTWRIVRRTLEDPERLRELQQVARDNADSIGARILVIGAALATREAVARRFEFVFESHPRFFEELDRANVERTTVIHHRAQAEEIHVPAFRSRVLVLCRVAASLDLDDLAEAAGTTKG